MKVVACLGEMWVKFLVNVVACSGVCGSIFR